MSEHTPTPWYLETTSAGLWIGIEKAAGGKVGDIIVSLDVGEEYNPWHNELAAANAAFIVKAVNLHDELVAAVRSFLADYDGFDDFQLDRRVDEPMFRKIKAARFILAKIYLTP